MDAPVRLESRIERVMVYRRAARVTRTASLAPLGGRIPAVVAIGGLPLALADDSVRVEVSPTAEGASVPVACELRVGLEVGIVDPSLRGAQSPQLQAARRREALLREEIGRLELEIGKLRALEPPPRPEPRRGEPPPPSPFDARMALLGFVASRSQAIASRAAELRAQLRLAEEERRTLEAQDREASSARQRKDEELAKKVLVSLRDGETDAARLSVSYVVPGARWCPSYGLQLAPGFSTARLAVRAAICQATGEDWTGVELALSSAEPERWHELPELASLRIGKRQARPLPRGWRAPPVGVEELFLGYDEQRARSPVPEPAATPWQAATPVGAAQPRQEATVLVADSLTAGDLREEEDEPTNVTLAGTTTRAGTVSPELVRALRQRAEQAKADLATEAAPKAKEPEVFAVALPYSSRAKSAGLLSGIGSLFAGSGGAADAPYPAAAPPAATELAARPRRSVSEARRAPSDTGLVADVDESLQSPDGLLAYGALRMQDASSVDRGKLVLVATRERYLEELLVVEHRALETRQTLAAVLDEGLRRTVVRAEEIASRELPPRCVDPASVQGFDHAYRASARVDVPSDGTFHTLLLGEQETSAHLRYVVVPRESTDVFRLVELDNPIDAPLLDGPVDVYQSGRYVLTADLRMVPAGARLSLGIGVEQRVKVARNARFAEETEGLMRGTIALKHEVSIEIANHLEEGLDLEVRERVPVTVENDDEVRVDAGKVDPPWEPWAPKDESGPPLRGGHRWRLTIPKGEKKTLTASYTVRTSSKNELLGGNRREA